MWSVLGLELPVCSSGLHSRQVNVLEDTSTMTVLPHFCQRKKHCSLFPIHTKLKTEVNGSDWIELLFLQTLKMVTFRTLF